MSLFEDLKNSLFSLFSKKKKKVPLRKKASPKRPARKRSVSGRKTKPVTKKSISKKKGAGARASSAGKNKTTGIGAGTQRRPKAKKKASAVRAPSAPKTSPPKKTGAKKKTGSRRPVKASARAVAQKPKKKRMAPVDRKPLKKQQSEEKLVGEITHYFSRIEVVVLKMTGVPVKVGDTITVKQAGGSFQQRVASLQVESLDVKSAKKGQLVGLKVHKKVRVGALVYK